MTAWALLIGAVGAAYLGFALLALSQDKHWRSVTSAVACTPVRAAVLRALGGLMLAAALSLALLRDGPSFGALLWVTVLSAAAVAVAFTLAWRPTWLQPLAACAVGRFARRNPASSK